MKIRILFMIFLLTYSIGMSQNIEELFKNKKYSEIIKLENKSNQMKAKELYMLGYSFFAMDNTEKSLQYINKSIDSGYTESEVYVSKYKILSYTEQYEEALAAIDLAVKKEPNNQEFMTFKGLTYIFLENDTKAIECLEAAHLMPNINGEATYWLALIYRSKNEKTKSLSLFYESLKKLDSKSKLYASSLKNIGEIELINENYSKATQSFKKAIEKVSSDDKLYYELHYKLMIAYNTNKEYSKAAQAFKNVQKGFIEGKLEEEGMETKFVPYHVFYWKKQFVMLKKSLVEVKNTLDISYVVFLYDSETDKIKRKFLVEKTIQLTKDGSKHLLCERGLDGTHYTYPYGWKTDDIPIDDLEKAVILVLEGKLKPGASSKIQFKED